MRRATWQDAKLVKAYSLLHALYSNSSELFLSDRYIVQVFLVDCFSLSVGYIVAYSFEMPMREKH